MQIRTRRGRMLTVMYSTAKLPISLWVSQATVNEIFRIYVCA
jgi:hypothetical protein